jgi:pyruvate dehydrogenase E1 component beta subunit
MLAHAPGLKLVAPTTTYDAVGLLRSAIRDDDPVMFIGHKFLYNIEGEIPDEDYTVPLGEAILRREGKDVTIIAWSRQVYYALEAAKELEKEGIEADVIDLRSLVPLDWPLISKSVKKTKHVVISEECVKRGGYASEIAAQIADELFFDLKAPIKVVGARNIVPPFSLPLEDAFFPHPPDIIRAVKNIVK